MSHVRKFFEVLLPEQCEGKLRCELKRQNLHDKKPQLIIYSDESVLKNLNIELQKIQIINNHLRVFDGPNDLHIIITDEMIAKVYKEKKLNDISDEGMVDRIARELSSQDKSSYTVDFSNRLDGKKAPAKATMPGMITKNINLDVNEVIQSDDITAPFNTPVIIVPQNPTPTSSSPKVPKDTHSMLNNAFKDQAKQSKLEAAFANVPPDKKRKESVRPTSQPKPAQPLTPVAHTINTNMPKTEELLANLLQTFKSINAKLDQMLERLTQLEKSLDATANKHTPSMKKT